jgi:hypothetical protein
LRRVSIWIEYARHWSRFRCEQWNNSLNSSERDEWFENSHQENDIMMSRTGNASDQAHQQMFSRKVPNFPEAAPSVYPTNIQPPGISFMDVTFYVSSFWSAGLYLKRFPPASFSSTRPVNETGVCLFSS